MLTLKNCTLIGYFGPVDQFLREVATNIQQEKTGQFATVSYK